MGVLRSSIPEERLKTMVQTAHGDDADEMGKDVIELVAEVRRLDETIRQLLVADHHRTQNILELQGANDNLACTLKLVVGQLEWYTDKKNFKPMKWTSGKFVHYSIPKGGPSEASKLLEGLKADPGMEWLFKKDEDYENYVGD